MTLRRRPKIWVRRENNIYGLPSDEYTIRIHGDFKAEVLKADRRIRRMLAKGNEEGRYYASRRKRQRPSGIHHGTYIDWSASWTVRPAKEAAA